MNLAGDEEVQAGQVASTSTWHGNDSVSVAVEVTVLEQVVHVRPLLKGDAQQANVKGLKEGNLANRRKKKNLGNRPVGQSGN